MDETKAKQFIDKHAASLKKFLCLDDIILQIKLQRSPDPNYRAECIQHIEYNSATIWIDPHFIEDEDDLLDVMFHEFGHIIQRSYYLYRDYATNGMNPDQGRQEQSNTIWTFSCEQGIAQLVKIWKSVLRQVYLDQFKPVRKKKNAKVRARSGSLTEYHRNIKRPESLG